MNKTLALILKIALHVVGFPLLFVLVYVINRDVIAGGSMYGVSVGVAFIFTAVMAIVYYLAYFLVRTRKKRSIRNQHIIVAIVAVCCLSGTWMLMDAFIPGPLSTATSSTIYWEDLSDNWGARAEVQEQLLHDYVTINYNLGRLTSPNGETAEDYIKQGPNKNKELKALLEADYHSIDSDGYASFQSPSIDYAQSGRMTIPVLLHLFFDDRSSVQGANSAYAKENNLPALEIPVPFYDLYKFDEQEATKVNVRVYHGSDGSRKLYFVTDQDLKVFDTYSARRIAVLSERNGGWELVVNDAGNKAYATENEYPMHFDTKEEAVAHVQENESSIKYYLIGGYRMSSVNWHVLDMLGTAMDFSLLSADAMSTDLVQTLEEGGMSMLTGALTGNGLRYLSDVFELDLIPDAMALVADMVQEDELLGSPIYITFDSKTGTMYLNPSNTNRGTLGYMEMAWLQNQGLLYIIVSLFSTRTLFYIYGPVMGIIAILLGLIREYEQKAPATEPKEKKEKKEKKKKDDDAAAPDAQGEDPIVTDDGAEEPVAKTSDDVLELVES